jgi:lipoic acid synthetase
MPGVVTKSSLMLGLGETHAEIIESMEQLRHADVEILTLGQYLRPSPNHAPVRDFIEPQAFVELAEIGKSMGFLDVAAGPLVRSSYKAGELVAGDLARQRRTERARV